MAAHAFHLFTWALCYVTVYTMHIKERRAWNMTAICRSWHLGSCDSYLSDSGQLALAGRQSVHTIIRHVTPRVFQVHAQSPSPPPVSIPKYGSLPLHLPGRQIGMVTVSGHVPVRLEEGLLQITDTVFASAGLVNLMVERRLQIYQILEAGSWKSWQPGADFLKHHKLGLPPAWWY